jgi:hypothetical protein
MAVKKKNLGNATGFARPEWALINPEAKPIRSGGIKRDYDRLFWEAEFYLHYEIADKTLASEFVKYCAKNFSVQDSRVLKKLPDYHFSTIGKYTYIANKGGILTQERADKVEQYYNSLLEKARKIEQAEAIEKEAESKKPAAPVVSIQDRMREQVGELAGELEWSLDQIVDGTLTPEKFEPYNMIKSYEVDIKAAHAKILRDMFELGYQEALEVVAWKDEDIKEGYAHLDTPRKRKQMEKFYDVLFAALDTVINEAKAHRKPRVKKSLNKTKLVEKIKFKDSESSLGLASINPVSIIGANALWVFNTKNRKLGIYRAEQGMELSVKGTTIVGFDAATSTQKTIRKPEVLLKGADKLARTKIDKLYKEVNASETKMNGRLNEHTLLLKVF